MRFDILTLFPEMFEGFLSSSMIKRAIDRDVITASIINFREYSTNKHRTVDDTPYGGGGGMVLKPEPLFRAVEDLTQNEPVRPPVLMMSPQGTPFTQKKRKSSPRIIGYSFSVVITRVLTNEFVSTWWMRRFPSVTMC